MSISGVLIQSFVILFVVCAGSEKKLGVLRSYLFSVVLIPFLSVYLFISFSLKTFFSSPKTVWRGFADGLTGKFDKKMRSGEDSPMIKID